MRKIWGVLMLLVASNSAIAQNKGVQLDSLLQYYVTEDNYNGVVLVAKGGNILLNKAYGYKDVKAIEKHTNQSVFQIGSLTKQFTAEVILYFVHDKKLKLTDDLSKFFPGYPNGDRIKIEHLLSHSSGIYDYTHDSLFAEVLQFKPVSKETMLGIFRDKPIDFEPGSKFAYSNSNYVLLGYIIEKITGKDYAQVVKDMIFKPAGMKNSGFDFVGLKDKNKSVGYDLLDGANSVAAPATDYTASYAAGAMYSTAADLYAWHKALQSYRFIPKELQEKAYTPYNDRYGFGWLADTIFDKRVLAHSGGISGFTSYILRVQEDDLCIVMLENNGNPATDKNNMMLHLLSCLYSDKFEMPISKPPVIVDKKILESYVGTYLITPDFSLSVSLSGNTLYIQGTGQPKIKTVARDNKTFYSKVVEATIEFVKERDGSISKLILHQSGRDIPAMKKN
jgi:CubicO group peptidase (beta-lactamase class C family)